MKNDKTKRKKGFTDTSYMPFIQAILAYLQERKGKSCTIKEISRTLKIHKSNYHLYRQAIESLIKQGKVIRLKGKRVALPSTLLRIKGNIQITKKGFGFVTDERTAEDIFIPAQYLHTAMHGDFVEVQLFAVSRGKSKEGQVVSVVRRAKIKFVGTYHQSEFYGFVVADDVKVYRDFYVHPRNEMEAKNGQKVVVEFLKWDTSALNPEGKIIEILGYPDQPGVDVISVVKGFDLPLEFPPAVNQEAEKLSLNLTPELVSQRLDLRQELIFTIDPPDAKDFDDAVSLTRLPDEQYRLGVHIADVSFFVAENNKIDGEALKRGTSIYLVDRVIPMLPEHLSNRLCSLQPREPRLTYSCLMDVNTEGVVTAYQIVPSIIMSKRRFSYEEAQTIIDDPKSKDSFASILREMRDFSQKLRKLRISQGSIDFETPEVRFEFDRSGKPVKIIPIEHLQSHELIEEFMLLANTTVAHHILKISPKRKSLPFIYRVHERPDREKLANFERFLQALNFQIKIPKNISPKQFQKIMQQVSDTKDDILIKEVALRTMMKAKYSSENIGHFGLAFENYTHFTSPIRRYPDLTVHRLLKKYKSEISPKEFRYQKKVLEKISEISSERERVALETERESIKIKQVEWIADRVGVQFNGIISGVTSVGIFVEIVPELIEGLVKIEDMIDDYYLFDEKTYSLIGKEFNHTYRLGDEINIVVKKVDKATKQVDFLIVSK
jgi:ribonuclease R